MAAPSSGCCPIFSYRDVRIWRALAMCSAAPAESCPGLGSLGVGITITSRRVERSKYCIPSLPEDPSDSKQHPSRRLTQSDIKRPKGPVWSKMTSPKMPQRVPRWLSPTIHAALKRQIQQITPECIPYLRSLKAIVRRRTYLTWWRL